MKKFSERKDLVKAAKQGIAVSVIYKDDPRDSENERNHYNTMLGFGGTETYKVCTILSEIKNMPGHYVVVGKNSQIVCGLHDEHFFVEED